MLKPETISVQFGCGKLKKKVSDGMSDEARLAMDLAKQDTPWKLCPIDETETGSSGYSSESPNPCTGNTQLTHTNVIRLKKQPLEPGVENIQPSRNSSTGSRQLNTGTATESIKGSTENGTEIIRKNPTGTENCRSPRNEKATGSLRFFDVYEKEAVPRLTGDITRLDSNADTAKLRSLCGEKLSSAMESVETVVYGEHANDDADADDTAAEESAIKKSMGKCRVWMIMNDQSKKAS